MAIHKTATAILIDGEQRAGVSQTALTDNTGGTADATLVDVTTATIADPAKINANFADVARLLNELRATLIALGTIKGSA